ncbi:hypothetical protein MSG28_001308 [Choristoneura fumiferana]|uniref:Uncharacterized protein n=1 Tax=Choristoneura fumiferana TaxID=7141 RepID=A0ACC0KTN4_CHOFU|nr:hypothetical protein MSG28_001308 [Choristoneura fumiferana]
MEAPLSDDSCDSEIKNMKNQLTEFGLEDENLTKEEMSDLIKAFNNSKSTAKEDELSRAKETNGRYKMSRTEECLGVCYQITLHRRESKSSCYIEETTRIQPIRSTRSGRSVPMYAGFDDDSSDLDFVITKTKKRKTSTSEHHTGEGEYSNKVISLKRKTSKDETPGQLKNKNDYR